MSRLDKILFNEEPEEGSPQEEKPESEKKKKRQSWLIAAIIVAVLIAIALIVLAAYPLFHVSPLPHGVMISIGKEQTSPEISHFGEMPEAFRGTGRELPTEKSPSGKANYPASTSGALSLQEIYKQVLPSVVTVNVQGQIAGTGVVFSSDGYILTNAHFVSEEDVCSVTLQTGETAEAVLVGSDIASDLAVLKANKEGLQPARFGDSDSLQVGDAIAVIGTSTGSGFSAMMTDGIVSGLGRNIPLVSRTIDFIVTNAAINDGNSGGPLLNCFGQVVGIATVKFSSTRSGANKLGFAVPIAMAKPIVDGLIARGYAPGSSAIGVTVEDIPERVAIFYGLPSGAYVSEVATGSDAYKQGLRPGDVICAADGVAVLSSNDLMQQKNSHEPGEKMTLTVFRDGVYRDISVTLMESSPTR